MEPSGSGGSAGAVTTYSVHGLVTIRLENAPRPILDDVTRDLGPPMVGGAAKPDLTIIFTDRLPAEGNLRFLGLNQAAFDQNHFYLLDTQGRRAQIAIDQLGEPSTIVCEAGIGHIPLLIPILGLYLLRKEHVLLHSSSFMYKGKGVLVTGWQKGGKTEMLLPFMAAGADYVADEWTIVGGTPPGLYGIAAVARVWEWHFRYLPRYWARIGRRTRLRLQLWRLFRRLYKGVPGAARLTVPPFGLLTRLSTEGGTAFQGVDAIPPAVLFRQQVWKGRAPLDRIFLAVLAAGDTRVVPVAAKEIAQRMVSSLAFERAPLLTAYQQFRFAFPGRGNPLLDAARKEELRLLSAAFAGTPAFEIRHPYPVPLPDLYHAAAPFCR